MDNGKRRKRRQLSPEEKWEVFLEVTSQEDAARKWGFDVSVIIRLRALAKDAALAAFASAKPGRAATMEAVELELLRSENDRLSEALKELAVELTLHSGGGSTGLIASSRTAAATPVRCSSLHRRCCGLRSSTGSRCRASGSAPVPG